MTRAGLRAVPEHPPKAVGLIRVSKERDGMISPDLQRAAIEAYATARGYEVASWLEGLDESGSRAKSAWWQKLDEGVRRIEDGEAEVLLVWKFSRAARHRLRWAVALDRVETAGGRLESATEQVDTTTSTGRFTRGMLAELQAFEAERIGEVWRDVHARRIAAGKPATGKPKWGYVYDPQQQLHVRDLATGPVLADLYSRYVGGESIYQLVRWLNGHGYTTLAGGMWGDRTLRRVMDSGFAAGLFAAGGQMHEGVHEPLIDRDLWQAYLDSRASRSSRPARVERSQYLLSGMVTCARCGGSMVAGLFGHARAPKYRCKRRQQYGPEACVGGYVMAAYVEGFVLEWLQELAGAVDEVATASLAADARRAVGRSEVDRLTRELVKVEEALQRLVVQEASSPDVPAAVFASARGELVERHRGMTDALEAAGRELRGSVEKPADEARALLSVWETSPVESRRNLVARLVKRVEVTSGRPRASLRVVARWE